MDSAVFLLRKTQFLSEMSSDWDYSHTLDVQVGVAAGMEMQIGLWAF